MAPEVLAGEQVDKSSDVYSFGVILYEIFVGERPWKDLKGEQIIFQILSGKRLKLPEGSEHPKIMALAKACLADNPKERPTFTEITERLLALRYEADGPAEAKGG